QGVLGAHSDAPVVAKPFSRGTISTALEELKSRLPAEPPA
ncbi:MAG: response regulator, partial [Alphaproteobacteria bacterium]|nr:response regulator [Alphaproteobacteria bacterium]